MPFIKDASYRNIPFSPETPSDDFQPFLSVTEMIEKIHLHPDRMFRCRTVGIVTCDLGEHFLHELDESNMKIRISLAYTKRCPPFSGRPYPAQLFGFLHWKEGVGPVIFAHLMQSIPAVIAVRMRETMKWVTDTHIAFFTDAEKRHE